MNAPMIAIFPIVTTLPAFPASDAPRKLMNANTVQAPTASQISIGAKG